MSGRNYILYVMGARGSRPVHGADFNIFGGQTSCFILKSGTHAVVIDCGTGLFDAETILKDCEIIDVIFTHVHYDHVIGMLDCSIFPKNARVTFFGTFSKWFSYETIKEFYRHPFWPVQPNLGAIAEITDDGNAYNLADGFVMRCYKSNHPDNGSIICIEAGEKKVSFLFDVEINGSFDTNILKGTNYLVFDGMFDDEEYIKFQGWGHSTYQEGCRLATVYGCDELLITHHNPKNDDKKLLDYEQKAKNIFSRVRFCRPGDIIAVE